MSTPFVMISYSKDGGHTWSHERKKPLVGSDKNYLNRVRIHRIGSAYSLILRVRYSDKSSFTLVSAHADIEIGT